MQFPCEIDTTRTLKKGMKITLEIDDENKRKVLKHLYNFEDMPLRVTFEINKEKRQEELAQISPQQRKKIYAIFSDIDAQTGQGKESIKYEMKRMFIKNNEYEMFSLSNCSKELASDFIEFLIGFCFQNGIELTDHPREAFENVERYIRLCLEKKICCVCGRSYSGDPHHVDTIGMGHDRKKVDDSKKLKLPLCYEEHHPEIHTIGDKEFCEKYHVKPVIYDDE